ncbi:MAG: tRNA 4-thiouridine(8) synthase ThiI [Candidatus Omnitrophota bacterium]
MKVIVLISGGLDSLLAAKLMQNQGMDVIGIRFTSPVFGYDRPERRGFNAETLAGRLGITLKPVDITDDILRILKSPRHGFGSNINPCIDCHTTMLIRAKEMMASLGASFIVTGEVVGQRPMSQGRNTLRMIDKEAGVERLVLRPLSAKVLEPTEAEEKGWVDRDKLYGITGRTRREQMDLAAEFGIKEYPNAAGGCLLTDPSFSRRVKDLRDHEALTEADVKLLKAGRQFRLTERARLVVGKNFKDDELLQSLRGPEDVFLEPEEAVSGASGLGRGDFGDRKTLELAARIVSRYFDKKNSCCTSRVEVSYKGNKETLEVQPFTDEEAKQYMV